MNEEIKNKIKKHSEEKIYISLNEYNNFCRVQDITYNDQFTKELHMINRDLIISLLSDDAYYSKAIKLIKSGVPTIDFFSVDNNEITESISINPADLLTIFDEINIPKELTSRKNTLSNLISWDRFLEQKKNITFEFEIDNKIIVLNLDQILYLISKPSNEIMNFINGNDSLFGLSKEEYFYIIKDFFDGYDLLSRFIIPSNIMKGYELIHTDLVDTESINHFIETTDKYADQIHINPKLREALFEGMEPYYDDMNKAIHLYIKMCQTLSYDPEFYANDQEGEVVKRHMDIEHISQIDPENNLIVCWEFSSIYGKLLHELGINYKIVSNPTESFGGVHTYILFRCGKFIVYADAVKSILTGDLALSKANDNLIGYICKNKNEKTLKEFRKKLLRVNYNIMHNSKDFSVSFDTALNLYKDEIKDNGIKLDFDTRLDMMLEKIYNTELTNIDYFCYICRLRKMLFNKDELENNIRISTLREKDPQAEFGKLPLLILYINNPKTNKSRFITYNTRGEVKETTFAEIQRNFNTHKYEYLKNNPSYAIAGIERGI